MPEGSPHTRTKSKSHPKAASRVRVSKVKPAGSRVSKGSGDATEVSESERERYAEIVRAAEELVAKDSDWQTFFREILGVDGLMRSQFSDAKQLALFEKSPEFDQIQILFAQLRLKDVPQERVEPTKMITVRLPLSLHKALHKEADMRATSLNKLCISKLLQVIDEQGGPQSEGNGDIP